MPDTPTGTVADPARTAPAAVPAAATAGLAAGPEPRGAWIAVLFGLTSLLGAALLFMVQPMAAKLILPSYGGSATVWSTSSLFFQVLLLLGYVYAHASTRRLGARWQPRAHLLVLAVPLLFLPVALPADAAPPADSSPTLWLLRTLLLLVGVPFLVLSTTGPLVQRWYAWSRGPRSDDPYFLFAGSNLGSFLGLLCYPFVVEPLLTLAEQRRLWSGLLVVFLALMATCALVVRAGRADGAATDRSADETMDVSPAPGPRRVLLWCGLAFLPSCLMLAVTAHISTDVAPIPLVWVVPLALYLASFIAAFARRTRTPPVAATRAAVVVAALSAVLSVGGSELPIWLVVAADLTTVTLVGYAAHARLAATRPGPEHLTGFYLVISLGGAIGGLVNGVLAPALTDRVWEYGASLAAVPLLLLGLLPAASGRLSRRYHPRFLAGAALVLVPAAVLLAAAALLVARGHGTVPVLLVLVATGAACWSLSRRPAALAVALLACAGVVGGQAIASSLMLERTFYGSYRLVESDGTHQLVHGTTVHGTQYLDAARRDVPTTYYTEQGPLGDALAVLEHRRTVVVGLGAGAIATYGRPGDRMDFIEIDPAIRDIAQDPAAFTYLADSAADVGVVIGDGRLALADRAPASLDLVVLDAFSSDAIPVHLLTVEAMEEYASRLAPGGSIVVHISNRVFDLTPVLTSAADELGWSGVERRAAADPARGATESQWVVLTPDTDVAAGLLARPGWSPLDGARRVRWSDDYASVLSVLR